jgi:hypothetical protein
MKKPINKFAVALWVLAVVIFAVEVVQVFAIISGMREVPGTLGDNAVDDMLLRSLATYVATPLQLAALGVLIELVDQIRWNALQWQK